MNPNAIISQSALEKKTTKKIRSQSPSDLSTKRLIMHVSQTEKDRFDRIKKDYLFKSGNYITAGSNAGFFSYCLELLVSEEKTKKLPEQYINYISRRGKRRKTNSEPRNIAIQMNLDITRYLKYITLMYFSTGGSPDISTAQFFPHFLDLVEHLKLS